MKPNLSIMNLESASSHYDLTSDIQSQVRNGPSQISGQPVLDSSDKNLHYFSLQDLPTSESPFFQSNNEEIGDSPNFSEGFNNIGNLNYQAFADQNKVPLAAK